MNGIGRAVRRIREDERGISLVELIVAMSITVLVIGMAGAFFASVTRASGIASGVDGNTRSSATAMREMQRMFRVASNNPVQSGSDTQYAFQYASPTSVRFFAYINLNSPADVQPTEVQFTFNPSTQLLTESKWLGTPTDSSKTYYTFPLAATPTLSATPTSKISLASSVVPTTLFAFRDAGGNPLGSAPGGVLSATELAKVRTVVITFTVGEKDASKPAAANNVTLTSTVGMPNLQFGG